MTVLGSLRAADGATMQHLTTDDAANNTPTPRPADGADRDKRCRCTSGCRQAGRACGCSRRRTTAAAAATAAPAGGGTPGIPANRQAKASRHEGKIRRRPAGRAPEGDTKTPGPFKTYDGK